jgi:hypothetical protein
MFIVVLAKRCLPRLLRVWQIVLVIIVTVDHELCSSISPPPLAFQLDVYIGAASPTSDTLWKMPLSISALALQPHHLHAYAMPRSPDYPEKDPVGSTRSPSERLCTTI